MIAPIAAVQAAQGLRAMGRACASADGGFHRKLLRDSIQEHIPEDLRPGLLHDLTEALSSPGKQRRPNRSGDLTVKDIAEQENVTCPTVRAWITSGSLAAHLVGQAGKRQSYRIAQTDYAEFRRRRVSTGAAPDASAESMRILAAMRGVQTARKE